MNNRGFTLVELTVVIFLIGLMFIVAIPRIGDTLLSDDLKTTVNHLNRTARELRNEAVRSQVNQLLNLDLHEGLIYVTSEDMTPEARYEMRKRAYLLPQGVTITDVSRPGKERVINGETAVIFFKGGFVQPTVIHIARGDERFTLVFSPFLKDIKVYDKLIELDEAYE